MRHTEASRTHPQIPPTRQNSKGNWAVTGSWSEEQLYVYISRPDDPGRMWTLHKDTQQMNEGVPVPQFGDMPACARRSPVSKTIVAASDNLFVYEPFGTKTDRTGVCGNLVPGGAWILDPATGQLKQQIARPYHFNRLVASRSGSDLYGIDPGHGNWSGPVQLLRIDARDGTVLVVRTLEPDVWAIAAAPLTIPHGSNIQLNLGFDKTTPSPARRSAP